MRPIDRILACSAWVFGLSWPPRDANDDPSRGERFAVHDVDPEALECCAAEGFAAERLIRENDDRVIR